MEASNHHGHTEENTKIFVNMHHLKSFFQDIFLLSPSNILNGFFIISYRGAEDFLSVKRMVHNSFYTAVTFVATI